MSLSKPRQPLSRRRILKATAAATLATSFSAKPAGAFLRGLPHRKSVLSVAAIQASVVSPDRVEPGAARAANLDSMLSLLDKVQTYGGHKDICLFPVIALPGDALPVLMQAARRYNCTIVYGTEGVVRNGTTTRLTTTIVPTGELRLEHAPMDDAAVLVLRTRNGVYRIVACAADAWYPGRTGVTTAIHAPDGHPIVATRSRSEQAVAAVLHVGELHTGQPTS